MSTKVKKKSRVRKYADSLKNSYRSGYVRGYNDAQKYGSNFGEAFHAGLGYYHGVKQHKQSERIQRKGKSLY